MGFLAHLARPGQCRIIGETSREPEGRPASQTWKRGVAVATVASGKGHKLDRPCRRFERGAGLSQATGHCREAKRPLALGVDRPRN
jgi:hypothetical protein